MWNLSEGVNIMRKKMLVVFFVFMVLVVLLVLINVSVYIKFGYVMIKVSVKNFKIYINGLVKGFKNIIISGVKVWNFFFYLNMVSIGNDVKFNFMVSSLGINKGSVLVVCNIIYYKLNKLIFKNEIILYKGFCLFLMNYKIEIIVYEFGYGFGLGYVKIKNVIMLDKGFINKIKF